MSTKKEKKPAGRPRRAYGQTGYTKLLKEDVLSFDGGGLDAGQMEFCRIRVEESGLKITDACEKAGLDRYAGPKLMRNPLVKERIDELYAAYQRQFECTFESHVIKLGEIRDLAIANGAYGPAVTAEKNRGMVAGLYIERKEILHGRIDQMSRDDVMKEIKSISREHPALQAILESSIEGSVLIEGELVAENEKDDVDEA